jgi:hypothetical protein
MIIIYLRQTAGLIRDWRIVSQIKDQGMFMMMCIYWSIFSYVSDWGVENMYFINIILMFRACLVTWDFPFHTLIAVLHKTDILS